MIREGGLYSRCESETSGPSSTAPMWRWYAWHSSSVVRGRGGGRQVGREPRADRAGLGAKSPVLAPVSGNGAKNGTGSDGGGMAVKGKKKKSSTGVAGRVPTGRERERARRRYSNLQSLLYPIR